MESGREAARKTGSNENEVVVTISSSEESTDAKASAATEDGFKSFSKDSQASIELERLKSRVQVTPKTTPSSPDTPRSPSASKPPKVPTESVVRRRSLGRSAYSIPKSRLLEPSCPIETSVEENTRLLPSSSLKTNRASPIHSSTATTPRDNVKTAPVTPQTPGGEDEEEEEDEEVYKTSYLPETEKKSKKLRFVVWIEWVAFVCIMGCLIASLTIDRLLHTMIWSLEIWKWSVLVLVIFCGRVVTERCINIVVFMIEKNYLFRQKVLYFVFGLKKSVLVFIWLGLILLAWGLLIDSGVKRSRKTTRILNYVTRALASCLVGAVLWLAKALLIKILASSFHVTRFFDRIQESLFHQYVLQTLSKPPSMETTEMVGRGNSAQLSFRSEMKQKGGKKEEVVDVGKLYKIDQEKVSAWTMKGLIDVIRGSRLTTISNVLDDSVDDEGGEHKDKEIANEWEARTTAVQIFENVAKSDPKYIHEKDLWCFMKKQDVDNLLPLFEGASETRKIKRSSFKKWVVKVYSERKSLALSLNDAKTAIEELNKITSGVTLIVIIIVWLLLMGLVTTKVLILISSQLLLSAFMFGNTCKTVFEAMIFVFVMHPFDVGDRCVIDGVQMTVEEVNILTTIFLRYDNEKIFYPNSVLATKPISNFYRSPEMGGDSVEFAVDFSTSMETIAALKDGIKTYLENKPQHWRPVHSVLVKDIVHVNQMNMALYVTHTINFQNYGDKSSRRSELVIELKKIFEELNIKYHLLPQEVHLRSVDSAPPLFPTTMR
ncbi:hypothetical protein VitviT2T_016304 [Vitis vinifera]|uniref:Mechanosensitive ion channel protein n=2 Tax=Vitis vinifera TaxID=29760 RepID=D7TCH8_VITVI|eukprot:XP_002278315.1 PREDICTED: mechanosensitive ion channel protein 10 [Vitis vinifera]